MVRLLSLVLLLLLPNPFAHPAPKRAGGQGLVQPPNVRLVRSAAARPGARLAANPRAHRRTVATAYRTRTSVLRPRGGT